MEALFGGAGVVVGVGEVSALTGWVFAGGGERGQYGGEGCSDVGGEAERSSDGAVASGGHAEAAALLGDVVVGR